MGHQHRVLRKFQELGQHRFHRRRVHHHGVIDPGQPLDLKGDRHFRIDKFIHAVRNDPVFHPDGSDLNDLILRRGKSGGFDIKDHESAV